MSTLTRSLFTTKKTLSPRRRPSRHRGAGRHEALEARLAMATLLGTDPLVFDPTPGNASSGDELEIGSIRYELGDDRTISVRYAIDAGFQHAYDLSAVHTTINSGSLGDENSSGLPDGTESLVHEFALSQPLLAGLTALDIDACATIEKRDVAAVGTALPSVGTVRVSTNGSIAGVPSYFDTILTPGWIPSSTDVEGNSVTFANDPGWVDGTAVRVVAGYVASLSGTNDTGLVTRPTATDTTASASYFVRVVSPGTYTFHGTYGDAITGTAAKEITGALPANGELVIAGENEALPFLGQTPINESLVPDSTKWTLTTTPFSDVTSFNGTTEQITLATTTGLANGDRVRVSAAFGGLSTTTSYWVRVLDGLTVELYGSYASAVNTASTSGRIGLSGIGPQTPPAGTALDTVDPDDETVSFVVDPGWADGTAVRVSASGGNLLAGTTYYVRRVSGAYAFYASLAESLNTDGNIDPLSGRRDLNAAVTASVFPNVTALSFSEPHGWGTGTVVRVSATGGGLSFGSNYYVRAIDADTISLHATLANAQAGTSPVSFTAPITALVTPMFDGWCVDDDRFIGGNELIANFYSSYEDSSFPDTTGHTKDQYGTDAGLSPVNTFAVASTTDLLNDRVTFAAAHGWSTGQAVRVTATEGGLMAGTIYYVRSINSTTVSFHATAAGATTNTGRIDLTMALSPTTLFFRCESVDFAVTTNWPNGTKVRVDVSDGGLVAGQNYYVRGQNVVGGSADSNSVSFYDTRANALAGGTTGLVALTDPLDATTKVYVPEELVENPENLDVMNWILNQNFQSMLAVGQTPVTTNDASTITVPTSTNFVNVGAVPDSTDIMAESVTFVADPGWGTGTMVRVTATGGGLTAGTNYYVRSLGNGEYQFYNSVANANAGTSTGRVNLTAPITAGVYEPSLASAEDTVMFTAGHGFVNGSIVNATADGGGLDASTTYWLKLVGPDTFSFHTSATMTDANKVDLTAAITAGVRLQSDETVTMPTASGWTTGLTVQVSVSAGGLVAGTDYWIRAFSTTSFAFYASAADASNNVNRIDLTGSVAPALVRPYYTSGDVQRAIWQAIENNPGDPGNWSPARVAEILAAANAAVGLDDPAIGYVPGCDGTVAIIIQPFEVVGGGTDSKSQVTIAQITVAEVPNYCADGFNCQEFVVALGSIGDFVWHDLDGDGIQDASEPGTRDVNVILLDGAGDPIGTGLSTTTGPDGSYLFTGLLPGSYSVQFVLPSGNYVFTRQNAGADDALDSDASRTTGRTGAYTLGWITTPGGIAVASDLSVDAGWVNPIDVCGVKVWDIDRDGAVGGISDSGDQRMAGVRIFVDDNTNGVLDWADSVTTPNGLWDLGEGEQWTTTGTDGSYCLPDLLPGTYVIREDMSSLPGNPAEWQSSGPVAVTLIEDGDVVDGVNFYNYKFSDGEYRTYTLGGYGGSGQPAAYLLQNFAGAFTAPTYLTVPRAGSANDIILTSGSQVQAFLRANNAKTAFTNPTVSKYVPSTLEKQFVALTLNVRFDATYPTFGSSGLLLGDLILCNLTGTQSAANGLTIAAFLSQVYGFLDGNGYTLGLSAGDLTNLLDNINRGFDNGGVTTWAEEHLCAAMPGVAAAMSTPQVQTITVMAPQTRDSVIAYRVTFTMPVSGVNPGDFTFTGSRGRLLSVTGRGAVYEVRALAPQVGETYRLALRDNDSIRAVFGNRALASAFAADGSVEAPGVRKIRTAGIRAFVALGS